MSKNHIFLLGALLFTLSALPGFSNSAEVQSVSLSSNGLPCDLRAKLGSSDSATCDFEQVTIQGQKVKGRVTVTKTKKEVEPEGPLWGETAKPEDTQKKIVEGADIEITTETECTTGCEFGIRSGSPVREFIDIKDARKINDFVLEKYKKAATDLAKEAATEAKKQAKIEQCLIDESGAEIAERERMSCRMDKFANLDEKKKEEYYDKFIKDDLQAMLSGNSPALRAQAMEMIKRLGQNAGGSVFMKESLTELVKYGQAHQIADALLAMNPNDPRRPMLLQQWASAQKYFEARGMQVNNQYAGVLSAWQMDSVTQDLTKYQQELTAIAEQHKQQLAAPTMAQQPQRPGMQPIGQPGRTMYGQPTTSYAPIAQPAIPGMQRPGMPGVGGAGRTSNGIPVIGGRVN